MFVKNSTARLRRVLLSPPEFLEAAPINKIAEKWQNTGLDHAKMTKEFALLCSAYRENGVTVETLPADPCRPNSVFARDFGCCIAQGYLLGRFKLPIRSHEHTAYRQKMEQLGIPLVCEVKTGLFEGGDFFFLDERALVFGMLDRTDAQGVAEIRSALEPLGYTVLGVPGNPAHLHLDMCFNLVTDSLAVGCPEALPRSFLSELEQRGIELVPAEEKDIFLHGCNLQALGDRRVLSLARNAAVNRELERRGLDVIALEITEILKAGGGPHCMTFPLERF